MIPISRRAFLRGTLAFAGAGSLWSAAGIDGATAGRASSRAAPVRARGEFVLEELTLAELGQGLDRRRWRAQDLVRLYRDRIEAIDRRGPGLRSVIVLNPDALDAARELDAERRTGHRRGPLHGIPVVIKDNIDTADRMPTSAGSLALANSIAPRDAHLVARLRAAGAVILGKTNLSEWANFRSHRSSSGWSAHGGQCRNPYVLDRNPCGSSSGTAVAVAANLAAVGIGTETDGSIVCPASRCGVVGLKPTVGRISRSGIIPISSTQDTAGPMTRTVQDAALLLEVLSGRDDLDPATHDPAVPFRWETGGAAASGRLDGVRLGVMRQFDPPHPEARRLFEAALQTLRGLGATLIDPVKLATLEALGEPEYTVMLFEFKAGLNAYLASLGPDAPVRTLAELIAFNERNAQTEMPYFGQEVFVEAEAKGDLSSAEYLEARTRARRLARDEGIDAALAQHDLEALVAPSGGPAWPTDLVNGDRFTGGSSTPAAVAGYPNLSVPAGFVQGLPVGISFFGKAWSEAVLIRCGLAFEQATRHRRPPRFLPAIEWVRPSG